MNQLTFAFDVTLDENKDTFIPAGTIVKIYPYNQFKSDSTKIIYNNQVIEYMNHSFIEYR